MFAFKKIVELGVFPVQLAVHLALQFVLVQLVLNYRLMFIRHWRAGGCPC